MLTEKGEINYTETLASIAEDKNLHELAAHIRAFGVQLPTPPKEASPVTAQQPDYSRLSSHFAITKMPDATCDGCQ